MFVLQAEAEKPEESRRKKNCLAMKTLTFEQMEKLHGGWDWQATICNSAGLGISTAIGSFFWPFGLVARAVFLVGCQMGSEYGWD